ncbi:MAG: hypothetical protein KIS78_05135 [Labilithrix sp.]|nr:hypothetical protein [Labilithrix sp.]
MAEERKHERHPTRVRAIRAREILDSRALPTVEVDVVLEDGRAGSASVPARLASGVGDEGAFAPALGAHEVAFERSSRSSGEHPRWRSDPTPRRAVSSRDAE